MFNNIKRALAYGDYKPVAFFLFLSSIWLGVDLFLEPNSAGVLPIPSHLGSYSVEDIIAFICIIIGVPGFIGITLNNSRILTVFLLSLTPVYVFIATLFIISPNPSIGSVFMVIAISSGWATIRSAGDGTKQ